MAALDLHFQALEDCASAARRVASELAELVSAYPAKSTDASIFGSLSGSSGLADVVDQAENMVDGELGHARSKLQGVERALDKVRENVRTANTASGAAA
ncbi:hypothetical protein [Nonomuraea basaltis]|uniref:hypothetical protein n=1 Tax=Nonomuraea basaltis TaxID=2495887 RepID=UPI00110C4BCD|nr:hypothetical protein [Nonomuraea basaltis]TMR89959.1 hypothetical protein EJK15_57910 [Nonomuraea basaltis]